MKAAPKLNVILGGYCACYLVWLNSLYRPEFEGLVNEQDLWVLLIGGICAVTVSLSVILVDFWVALLDRRWLTWSWAAALSVFMLSFCADLLIFRKTGVHIGTIIRLFFGSGLEHLLKTKEILGVDDQFVFVLLTAALVILSLLVVFVRFNRVWFPWGMVSTSSSRLSFVLGLFVVGYSVLAVALPQTTGFSRVWIEAHRVLPTTPTIGAEPAGRRIESGVIAPYRRGVERRVEIAPQRPGPIPDIYVIVIESMRGDFMRSEIAPNLTRFKDDCLAFRDTLAASNASHTSWFSLLTGRYPLYFGMAYRESNTHGSNALRILRGVGYKLNVFSSSYLGYHKIDQIVFGDRHELADSFFDQRGIGMMSRPDRDRTVIEMLRNTADETNIPKCSVGFLASSHHDYHWPADYNPPFLPVADMWNYYMKFDISADELERIKNRYRNSLHFTDSIIGGFLDHLKDRGLYEESIILVTSDHGEAFLEHGKLVHASDLYREQIHVPFLLKLPKSLLDSDEAGSVDRIACHTDFFPTVFDALRVDTREMFDGRSLLRREVDFVVTVDDNGNRDPFRFCLHSGDLKSWFSYRSSATFIGAEDMIYWQGITDLMDQSLGVDIESEMSFLDSFSPFESGLRTLYPGGPW